MTTIRINNEPMQTKTTKKLATRSHPRQKLIFADLIIETILKITRNKNTVPIHKQIKQTRNRSKDATIKQIYREFHDKPMRSFSQNVSNENF